MNNKFRGVARLAFIIMSLGIGMFFLTSTWAQKSAGSAQMLNGQGTLNDWANEKPGNHYLIKASDLPKPYATDTATNRSTIVPRPADAWPQVPEGFKIDQAAT